MPWRLRNVASRNDSGAVLQGAAGSPIGASVDGLARAGKRGARSGRAIRAGQRARFRGPARRAPRAARLLALAMPSPAHPTTSSTAIRRTILLAVLGLWLARGALVLSQADVFGYEEFAKAELGRAMLDDLGIEHHRLAYHYYEVGGFVFSHLFALAFALFGDSVLAIKLVAIGWHSGVLALAMALAHAAYGRRAMLVAALLLVLPPASLQKLSLLALGIHFDSLLF